MFTLFINRGTSLALILFMVLGLLLPVSNAFAEEKIAKNEDTGSGSSNTSQVSSQQETNVAISNSASVDTSSTMSSNTGGNSASNNSGGGSVVTGDAGSQSGSTTQVNETTATVPCGSCTGGSATAVNSNTGAESTNASSTTQSSSVDASITNTSNSNTDIVNNASTGGNTASHNTGDGVITTGDVSSNVVVNQSVNTTQFTVSGQGSSSVSAVNDMTGANSSNTSTTSVTNTITIDSTHDAVVDTLATVSAITGNNSSSYNTGSGIIKTGNVYVSALFDERVNESLFDVECTFCTAEIVGVNRFTGYGSFNLTDPNIHSSVLVKELKKARIHNNLFFDLLTGGNNADFNTGGGLIETGDIFVDVTKKVTANVDVVGIGGGPFEEIIPGTPPSQQQSPEESHASENVTSKSPASVLAAAIGGIMSAEILPATGGNWMLVIVFIAMIFIGFRFRSYRPTPAMIM